MDGRFKTLEILWIALLAGVATYASVAFALLSLGVIELGVLAPSVLAVAAGAVVVYMAGALAVRRRMLEAIPQGATEDVRFGRYQVATLVALALLEAGGLVLVTLGILADTPTWVLAGGCASLWMMAVARPRRDEAGL